MQRKKLAKTSSTPGKTQLINHFSVNQSWYLVDLPGYGFAKVSKGQKQKFERMISDYILGRENLVNVFVLVDSRHTPQQIDLEFMEWLGVSGIPFSIVFTKMDKLKRSEVNAKLSKYQNKMLETWEELPQMFETSAEKNSGREDVLHYIETLNKGIGQKFTQ
jgi:GTP-binding protein